MASMIKSQSSAAAAKSVEVVMLARASSAVQESFPLASNLSREPLMAPLWRDNGKREQKVV